ncbi:MAG: hypothetical protein QXK88_09135 [Desulfurococcaceae archaeon]
MFCQNAADSVVSEIEEEVLMLAGRYGIALEDVSEGLYSLKADPDRRIRSFYPPQY